MQSLVNNGNIDKHVFTIKHAGISSLKSFSFLFKKYFLVLTSKKKLTKILIIYFLAIFNEKKIQSLSEIEIYFFIDKWNIQYALGEHFKDKKFLIIYIKGEED